MPFPFARRAPLAVAGALAAAAFLPGAAQAAPTGVGQFPASAGCTADELNPSKSTIYNRSTGNRIGAVRLMYSPRCQTWWGRVVNDTGRPFTGIVLANGRQAASERIDAGTNVFPGSYDTRMVAATELVLNAQGQLVESPKVGQAVGTLFRVHPFDVAGSAETARCLPPVGANLCPTPPS